MLRRMWSNWSSHTFAGQNEKWKTVWQVLINIQPRNPTPSSDLREMKICSYKHHHVADLFIIAKNKKQEKCPSTAEWINEL